MNRPSKKDIKAAIDKLKERPAGNTGGNTPSGNESGKLAGKKSSQRIRKQGV